MYINHIVLLTGQSNAMGCGGRFDLYDPLDSPHADIYAFDPYISKWVEFDLRNRVGGKAQHDQCLAFHYAKRYIADNPGSSVGIIVSGEAGQGISRWVLPQNGLQYSSVNKQDTGDHYALSVAMVKNALLGVTNTKIHAILWHQGESDYDESNTYYINRLHAVIKQYRSEEFSARDIPFVAGELIHNNDLWAFNKQNVALVSLNEGMITNVVCVRARFLCGNYTAGDIIHFSSSGHRRLGSLYYDAYTYMYNSTHSSSHKWYSKARLFIYRMVNLVRKKYLN